MIVQIQSALYRARAGIAIMASVYAISVGTGFIMVHTRSQFALACRDTLVADAHRDDPAARANDAGAHAVAAALDFSRNLGLAAVPDTIGGYVFVMPIGTGAYRGWVGGIVSVDAQHRSRLRVFRSALYYTVTMLLQLAGFTLAAGAGLHLGWANIRRVGPFFGPAAWSPLPKQVVLDVAWLYVLVVTFFALGSTWEFLGPTG